MAGLANNLLQLVCLRSAIGVGEAAFGAIASPMLADFYPMQERNVMFAILYTAIPVGGALGYVIGALVGKSLCEMMLNASRNMSSF
jgi:MFS transporter, Spinster family, sphingosine-1-phosphate transporter